MRETSSARRKKASRTESRWWDRWRAETRRWKTAKPAGGVHGRLQRSKQEREKEREGLRSSSSSLIGTERERGVRVPRSYLLARVASQLTPKRIGFCALVNPNLCSLLQQVKGCVSYVRVLRRLPRPTPQLFGF